MSKGVLPIAAHQLRRLYNKLFVQPCFLCGQLAFDQIICQACTAELPRLQSACQRCALPLPAPTALCGQCLKKPPVQTATFAVFIYQPPVDKCIAAFKFHHQLAFSDFFARQMALQHQHRTDLPACLMPIPLHPRRLRKRGYNQAAELAQRLGAALDMPYDLHSLVRTRHTAPQSELPVKARKSNLRGAFDYISPTVPESVALIDDVMTTGQTVAEACRCLKKHGVQTIEIWTIARAIRHY